MTPDLALDVRWPECQYTLTATALGKWHGIEILKAITTTFGTRTKPVEIDYRKVTKRLNLHGLNEDQITRAAAAAGVSPYLVRSSNYRIAWTEDGPHIMRPPSGEVRRLRREGYREIRPEVFKRATAGELTWPVLHLMAFSLQPVTPPETIRLYSALRLIGLLRTDYSLTMPPSITWLPRAYLRPPTAPVELSAEDEADLEGLVT